MKKLWTYLNVILFITLCVGCEKNTNYPTAKFSTDGDTIVVLDPDGKIGEFWGIHRISQDSFIVKGNYGKFSLFVNYNFDKFLGKVGNGRGEYNSISGFTFKNDTLFLFNKHKLLIQMISVKNNIYLGEIDLPESELSSFQYSGFEYVNSRFYFGVNGYSREIPLNLPYIIEYNIKSKLFRKISNIGENRKEINPIEFINNLKPLYFNEHVYFYYTHSGKLLQYNINNYHYEFINIRENVPDIDEINKISTDEFLRSDKTWNYVECPANFGIINRDMFIYQSQIGDDKHYKNRIYFISSNQSKVLEVIEYPRFEYLWVDSTYIYFQDSDNRKEHELLRIVKVPHGY